MANTIMAPGISRCGADRDSIDPVRDIGATSAACPTDDPPGYVHPASTIRH